MEGRCKRRLQLRDSGPCVVRKWRFGRPVPNVETTFTRPNPGGDVTKCRCRYQISVLAPYKAGHLNCRMSIFLRHRGSCPVVPGRVSRNRPAKPCTLTRLKFRRPKFLIAASDSDGYSDSDIDSDTGLLLYQRRSTAVASVSRSTDSSFPFVGLHFGVKTKE